MAAVTPTGAAHKNVLILMSDEQRWDTLGSAGNPAAQTPHLDALAARGTTFDRCYTPYPLCCPARASLWTSRMPHNHHVWANWLAIRPELRDGGIAARFADAGYHTLYTGKWHVPGTTPARFGFADTAAIPAVMQGRDRGRYIEDYRAYATARGHALLPHHMENLTAPDVATLAQPGRAPCGTAAIPLADFLEPWQTTQFLAALDRRPAEQPFFAVCSYNAPHFPMIVPAPYNRLIDPASLPLWENFRAGIAGKPDEVLQSHYFTDTADLDDGEWRRLIAHYLGFCALVDAQVGRVIEYLRDTGTLDQTIIVYLSDHGDMIGSHGLNQKGHLLHYEETLRVPLIIAHPDDAGGRRSEAFVSLVDLLPTLAALAGVATGAADAGDGRSFAPLLSRPDAAAPRTYAIAESYAIGGGSGGHGAAAVSAPDRPDRVGGHGEYLPPAAFDPDQDSVNLSIRTPTHRYIFRWRDRDELYDVRRDPGENVNISGEPDAVPMIRALRHTLADALQGTFPAVDARLRG